MSVRSSIGQWVAALGCTFGGSPLCSRRGALCLLVLPLPRVNEIERGEDAFSAISATREGAENECTRTRQKERGKALSGFWTQTDVASQHITGPGARNGEVEDRRARHTA